MGETLRSVEEDLGAAVHATDINMNDLGPIHFDT